MRRNLSKSTTAKRSEGDTRSPSVPAGRSARPVGCLEITSGQQVYEPAGRLGVVDEVLIGVRLPGDAWIVVRRGEGLPCDALIPYAWILSVDEMGIQIRAANQEL